MLNNFQGDLGYMSAIALWEPSPNLLLDPVYTQRALDSWLGHPTACTLPYLSLHMYLQMTCVYMYICSVVASCHIYRLRDRLQSDLTHAMILRRFTTVRMRIPRKSRCRSSDKRKSTAHHTHVLGHAHKGLGPPLLHFWICHWCISAKPSFPSHFPHIINVLKLCLQRERSLA